VALLLLEVVAGNEEGVVAVSNANGLDLFVEVVANLLPSHISMESDRLRQAYQAKMSGGSRM
jgi:hypothetical protein